MKGASRPGAKAKAKAAAKAKAPAATAKAAPASAAPGAPASSSGAGPRPSVSPMTITDPDVFMYAVRTVCTMNKLEAPEPDKLLDFLQGMRRLARLDAPDTHVGLWIFRMLKNFKSGDETAFAENAAFYGINLFRE